jgi:hypothetical protein
MIVFFQQQPFVLPSDPPAAGLGYAQILAVDSCKPFSMAATAAAGAAAAPPPRQSKLEPREELRVEVPPDASLRMRLVTGTAEIFGTELPPEGWVSIPPRSKIAVSTTTPPSTTPPQQKGPTRPRAAGFCRHCSVLLSRLDSPFLFYRLDLQLAWRDVGAGRAHRERVSVRGGAPWGSVSTPGPNFLCNKFGVKWGSWSDDSISLCCRHQWWFTSTHTPFLMREGQGQELPQRRGVIWRPRRWVLLFQFSWCLVMIQL